MTLQHDDPRIDAKTWPAMVETERNIKRVRNSQKLHDSSPMTDPRVAVILKTPPPCSKHLAVWVQQAYANILPITRWLSC